MKDAREEDMIFICSQDYGKLELLCGEGGSVVVKHRWFSGRIIAFQAVDPGSIPGRCTFLPFLTPYYKNKQPVTLYCYNLKFIMVKTACIKPAQDLDSPNPNPSKSPRDNQRQTQRQAMCPDFPRPVYSFFYYGKFSITKLDAFSIGLKLLKNLDIDILM